MFPYKVLWAFLDFAKFLTPGMFNTVYQEFFMLGNFGKNVARKERVIFWLNLIFAI